MAQGVLPFKYEAEKKTTGMTALAGLPAYLDLAKVMGLSISIRKHLKVREGGQGWTDSQVVLSIVLLNLAGGDCVEDLKVLEGDDGFCEVLKKAEMHGLRRKVRRTLLRRWRQERTRAVLSPPYFVIWQIFMIRHKKSIDSLGKPLFRFQTNI